MRLKDVIKEIIKTHRKFLVIKQHIDYLKRNLISAINDYRLAELPKEETGSMMHQDRLRVREHNDLLQDIRDKIMEDII